MSGVGIVRDACLVVIDFGDGVVISASSRVLNLVEGDGATRSVTLRLYRSA